MTARLIDGKAVGQKIRDQVRQKIAAHTAAGRRAPCLAVILVGDDPASQVYVSHKEKACAEAGIKSKAFRLPAATSESDLLAHIKILNTDSSIDGILPQLPMPRHIDRVKVISAIDPGKDVDGLSFFNQGRLLWNLPALRPCTPAGVM
jgi:methylenetetrahydrofolate dehydrogenase (NADP+)/methenyltetrahydrofolate cyclohydrolase